MENCVTCRERRLRGNPVKKPNSTRISFAALVFLSAEWGMTKVARPQEFSITIRPDGKIILDMNGVRETSYRRIIEFLEETVGPVSELEVTPSDPPERHICPTVEEEEQETRQLRLGK